MYLLNGIKYKLVGHQTLTVAASAVGPTLSGDNVMAMVVRINDASLRWRADGTDPTASVGKTERATSEILLTESSEIANFKAIRTGSDSSEIDFVFLTGAP